MSAAGGLASFWVWQRQIGIRRAVGARRRDILAYFLLENILITGMGCLLGLAGAWLPSRGMMRIWELPALPWWYLPLGAAGHGFAWSAGSTRAVVEGGPDCTHDGDAESLRLHCGGLLGCRFEKPVMSRAIPLLPSSSETVAIVQA